MKPMLWAVEWQIHTHAAIRAVREAGDAIRALPRLFEVKAGESHRSGITQGDVVSQEILFRHLEKFSNARFLCEEDTSHPRAFSKRDPAGILETELCFVLDSLDATARYGSELDGWCVAAGIMKSGKVVGGALYAPASNGGFLIASELGQGVIASDWNGKVVRSIERRASTPLKKSVVLLGVDSLLYRNATDIVADIASNVRAVFTSGSGSLGLAWVAAGRAQVVIQTPQKIWDIIPGFRMALETGNEVRLFRFVKGERVPVENLDYEAFRTLKETSENRLGYVAGEPALAQKIFDMLPRTGWERTVS